MLFRTIGINKEGVSFLTPFSKLTLTWEDIKAIGVTTNYPGITKKPVWIYFTSEKLVYQDIKGKKITNDFISANYREEMIKEIRKYWPHEIYNLSSF